MARIDDDPYLILPDGTQIPIKDDLKFRLTKQQEEDDFFQMYANQFKFEFEVSFGPVPPSPQFMTIGGRQWALKGRSARWLKFQNLNFGPYQPNSPSSSQRRLIGVRGWYWHRGYGLFPLVFNEDGWPIGVNEAVCLPKKPHEAPASGCECGLWLRESTDELYKDYWYSIDVAGVVEAWGTCIKHELGWRCQKMRILGLFDTDGMAREAALFYDVPLIRSAEEALELAK